MPSSASFLCRLASIFHRPENSAEAVHVLDFHLWTELGGIDRADADIGIAAEAAFFHIAGGYAQILQDAAQLDQILAGFFRRAQVRLADDLPSEGRRRG